MIKNREIKFRVITKDKKIYDVISLHWYRPEVEPKGICGVTIKTESGYDRFIGIEEIEIIVEFTGLKDCKGVEIYEGDVLYPLNKRIDERIIQWVVWDSKNAKFGLRIDEKRANNIPTSWEVIGNVYSNPELLK